MLVIFCLPVIDVAAEIFCFSLFLVDVVALYCDTIVTSVWHVEFCFAGTFFIGLLFLGLLMLTALFLLL